MACLKSNMDRFIEFLLEEPNPYTTSLKSNMDRFIAYISPLLPQNFKAFKIQYG